MTTYGFTGWFGIALLILDLAVRVLAVIIVGDDHKFAFGESLDRRFDFTMGIGHSFTS